MSLRRPEHAPKSIPAAGCFVVLILASFSPSRAGDVSPLPPFDIPSIQERLTLAEIQEGVPPGRAASVSDFVQRNPREGLPSSQRTTAYVAYDSKYIYVGFRCLDTQPEGIRAHVAPRDAIAADDRVGVMIDTYNDHRRAYSFWVNPLGIQSDALYTENRREDDSFDTQWRSSGRLTSTGFVALMIIPFKSLRFSPERQQTWGITFFRYIAREDEFSTWPALSRSINGRLIQEGEMSGLKNLSHGKNLQITPYGYFSSRRVLDWETNQFRRENLKERLGMDVKWVFGTNMTLDATLNPDFSQVESDEPQITINQRFEVFFPEKRPFFMENSDFFETPITVLFTRRIADPQYGLRLTGKVGPTTIAALATDDRSPGETVPLGDPSFGRRALFDVLRVSRDLQQESSLGFIWSDREFRSSYNRVLGVDGRWKISTTTGLDFQALESFSRDLEANTTWGRALHISLDHSALHWNVFGAYDERAPGFDVASGFIPRVDIRSLRGRLGYTFRPESGWVVAWQPNVVGEVVLDHLNVRQDLLANPGFWMNFKGGTRAFGDYLYKRERYEGLDFLKRQYDLNLRTRANAWFTLRLSYERGEQINYSPAVALEPFLGRGEEASFHLTLRPSRRLAVESTVLQNRLLTIVDDRNIFNNNVFRSKWTYQFTPRLSLRLIGQYANVLPSSALSSLDRSKNLNGDILLTYLVHPGTALYVGYNNNLENYNRNFLAQWGVLERSRSDLLSTGAGVFLKFSYLYHF
jgi:hypothetical protein